MCVEWLHKILEEIKILQVKTILKQQKMNIFGSSEEKKILFGYILSRKMYCNRKTVERMNDSASNDVK